MRGRPRLYSAREKKFYDLYLDPMLTPAAICRACGISKSTFYKYENELNRPQYRVAIGNSRADLPLKLALQSFMTEDEKLEIAILRKLARHLEARIQLIPTTMERATQVVRDEAVDFAMASLTRTLERSKDLYFSESYLPNETPFGVLMRLKNRFTNESAMRPKLGVAKGGIHAEYAKNHLNQEFKVLNYRNPKMCFEALQNGHVDFLLFHPLWLDVFPNADNKVEICSPPFYYKSQTALLFHRNSQHLITDVNHALEILFETKPKYI